MAKYQPFLLTFVSAKLFVVTNKGKTNSKLPAIRRIVRVDYTVVYYWFLK